MASCACTLGVDTHAIHRYAQLGCGALVARSQVSAQPVAPSLGMVSATLALAAFSVLVWYGHAAPATTAPFWNNEISVLARAQYFLINGCSDLSNDTAALNSCWARSVGWVIA